MNRLVASQFLETKVTKEGKEIRNKFHGSRDLELFCSVMYAYSDTWRIKVFNKHLLTEGIY